MKVLDRTMSFDRENLSMKIRSQCVMMATSFAGIDPKTTIALLVRHSTLAPEVAKPKALAIAIIRARLPLSVGRLRRFI